MSRLQSIVVNGRFLTQSMTGVQRYSFELLRALDRLLRDGDIPPVPVTVLVPSGATRLPAYEYLQVQHAGHLQGQLWEQIELPRACCNRLLFTPCGGAPVTHRDHVITIHDAGPFRTPQAYTVPYRMYYKTLQRRLVSIATRILTVSEFSRRHLMEALNVPDAKITRTYESGEHVLNFRSDSSVLARHGLTQGKYVLAVSSANPNKNLARLIEAGAVLRQLSIPVAIAGGTDGRIFGRCECASGSVKKLGVVSDAELRALYEGAGCFVFPSLYEGFGLPPMEALSLGCPVVVSRSSALPEVFGEAALYCDPYSPADIAAQIQRAMCQSKEERKRGQTYAKQFTWERCARETWDVLLRAMGAEEAMRARAA